MSDLMDDSVKERATRDAELAARGEATRPKSGSTLRAMVELVRRIMRSDTISIASISLGDKTITRVATSGFRLHDDEDEGIAQPLLGATSQRAARSDEVTILQDLGRREDIPVSEFPLHIADGVRDVALAPLRAQDETLGILVVGYRRAHQFTDEEKQMLKGLAEMAAVALDNARLLEVVSAGKKIWEQTFDAISDGLIVHDHRMQIVRCNARAAEIMNLLPSEAIGLSCADAFVQLFGERAAAYHMERRASSAHSSFELQAEGGRHYLVSVAPLDDAGGGGRGGVITWSDVTELSEMQEQLSRSRRLATIGQLAAGVAHEINNPLAVITTCAEATLRDVRSSHETETMAESRDWTFYLEEIVRQSLRCKAITRGLLDLSRQRRARRAPCDLNSLAMQCARLAEQRAPSEAVMFKVNLDLGIDEVATDAGMVQQVLDNLLSNALDAVGERGEIRISTMREGERVTIEVADTGLGIAPELLVRIFDPFFTTKHSGRGSGLGLAICYMLAEALGGALTVESKPGAGSRFRLWLPCKAPEKEETKV